MVKEIEKVLTKYSDPDKASEVFDETFSKNVLSRFAERHFQKFLKDLDPKNRTSLQMVSLDKESIEEMTEGEIKVWNEERNAPDLDHLTIVYNYEVLSSKHLRESKKEEAVNRSRRNPNQKRPFFKVETNRVRR